MKLSTRGARGGPSDRSGPGPVMGLTGGSPKPFTKIGLLAIVVAGAVALFASLALASHGVDLTAPGSQTEQSYAGGDDAIFKQADFTATSLGTGLINSFLRVQAEGVASGFNTDAKPPFDAKAGPYTKSISLSEIPQVELDDGTLYREVWLDINESGSEPLISLDTFEVYTSTDPRLTEADYAGGTLNGADLQYALEGASLILDYSNAQGSGNDGDLVIYIPESYFDDISGCAYTSSTCDQYFILYVTFGAYGEAWSADTSADPAGFEEFFVVDRPAVSVAKTAVFDETTTYDWTLTKTVDPDSHVGFNGDSFSSTYEVTATRSDASFSKRTVSGEISIVGTAETATVTSVDDLLADFGGTVEVSCDADLPVDLDVGDSLSCTYTAHLVDADGNALAFGDTNTARVALESMLGSTPVYTDTVPVVDGTIEVIGADLTVRDNFNMTGAVELGTTSTSQTWTYEHRFDCTDENSSTTGTTTNFDKEATSNGGHSATASVSLTCYEPTITSTQTGTFDQVYDWSITKSVDNGASVWNGSAWVPNPQLGDPGETLDWTWTVDVDRSDPSIENIVTSGFIEFTNPHPTEPLTFEMAQVIADQGIKIVDETDFSSDCQGTVTVDPATTKTCSFSVSATPTEQAAFSGAFSWTATAINDTATVDDALLGINGLLVNGDTTITAPAYPSASNSHTCSTDWADYGADGTYGETVDNQASVTDDDGPESAVAQTSYECRAANITVAKTTNGAIDPTRNWTFELYAGPGGYGTAPLATATTSGDADGVLNLNAADGTELALSVGGSYTLCEVDLLVGWESTWDGGTTSAYNPDAPEDLGNRCVDLTISASGTVSFTVDNQSATGGQRTPGYWKNWATCSATGRQALTAAQHGGAAAGYWLIDDVLPITWSYGVDADGEPVGFTIESCEAAIAILSSQDSAGATHSSDPVYRLARSLLAAQANGLAGASTCGLVDAAIADAIALLGSVEFDGDGDYGLKGKAGRELRAAANELATILDDYNNGLIC